MTNLREITIQGKDADGNDVTILTEAGGPVRSSISFADTSSIDGFARLRVSNPTTLFDSKQIFDNAPLFWDDEEVSGTGTTSTHSTDRASSTLLVAASTAGKRVRQTYQSFNYQPGKSQLVLMTGVLDCSGGGAGITRGFGLFNDDNGLFLRDNEETIEFVRRTSSSGSAVDNAVAQASWNKDKMDGTGPSSVTLDSSKTQILFIDFEWLGVGRVRMGFVIDGIPIICHEFDNANVLDVVYMSTPNLPLRYEIENDGTGVESEIEHICTTIISEGGSSDNGILRYNSTANTQIQANSAGTIYTICAIRLKTAYIGATVKIKAISMITDTTDDFEWLLILNPDVANAVTFNDETNSSVQFAIGNTGGGASNSTLTNGTILSGGVVKASGSTGDVTIGIENARLIGGAIDGTRDEIYLGCRPYANGANIDGGITWRELS